MGDAHGRSPWRRTHQRSETHIEKFIVALSLVDNIIINAHLCCFAIILIKWILAKRLNHGIGKVYNFVSYKTQNKATTR